MLKKINQTRYKIIKEHAKTEDKIAKAKEGKESRWLWEFSKKLVTFISIAFFVAMCFAGFVMYEFYADSAALIEWINAWKDIMLLGVFSYAVKAAVENAIKIYCSKKYYKEEDGNNNDPNQEAI